MPDLSALLSPASVAVVGASPDPHILRGRIVTVLGRHAFPGPIYPISRSHAEIGGRKAYRGIAEAPGPVDLAVLIIPAASVPAALEECAAAGAKAALILASGFAEEPTEAGRGLQDEIRAIAARTGLLVAGPNSEGFANMALKLCPTFSPAVDGEDMELVPEWSRAGRVAAVAQSGGMGFAFYDRGRPKGLRFSHVVTTGNEACIESLDVVEHLIDADEADVFLMFMEDAKTPAKLARVAEKALRAGKPMVVAKIGASEAGARAAASHTAALTGSSDIYRAIFRRYGVVEGRDAEEMADIAAAFSHFAGRLPAGRRVGIFTGSGGGGGWLADACVEAGLEVPALDDATRAGIDRRLPPYGSSRNPVDGTANAIREIGYARMKRIIAGSDSVDAVLSIASARNPLLFRREAEALAELARETAKPMAFWSYTLPHPDAAEALARAGLPLFTNMRNAARAMAALAEYGERRRRFLAEPPAAAGPLAPAAAAALDRAPRAIAEVEAMAVLNAAGIAAEAGTLVRDAEAAGAAAERYGRPVVLKIQSPDIPHKSAAGGVVAGARGAGAARRAYDRIRAAVARNAPDARILGTLVQPMAPPGLEIALGIDNASGFGPILMAGLGGTGVEAARDTVFAPAPVSAEEARALLGELRCAPLLDAAARDVAALADLMARLSAFAAAAAGRIAEIDLNPVLVHGPGEGVSIVDALMFKHSDERRPGPAPAPPRTPPRTPNGDPA